MLHDGGVDHVLDAGIGVNLKRLQCQGRETVKLTVRGPSTCASSSHQQLVNKPEARACAGVKSSGMSYKSMAQAVRIQTS